jgi:predicted amidohydrolase
MAMESLKIAVCSLTATSDRNKNIEIAFDLVKRAAADGADWIFLPEMFTFHGSYEQLFANAEFEDGPLNQKFSKFAKENNVVVFAGSVGERPKGATSGKVYNTQYIFDRSGSIVGKYRKVHLFNLKSQDGSSLYCESDGYLAGDQVVRVSVEGWEVGLSTCYDLRFTEMYAKLVQKGPLDLLAIPAAFTLQTGMYHWELLCRARAVENLCYVAAANQVGLHSPGKASYGHSLVVDPWGQTIASTGNQIGFAISRVSKESLNRWRSLLPVLSNKRHEVYR